jgi:nitrogen PTS system EIIA component
MVSPMAHRTFFNENLVLLDVEAADKFELIEHMVDQLSKYSRLPEVAGISREIILETVAARERERPTGLGNGFAFPHGRIPGFPGVGLCFAILKTPLDFGAPDGKGADMIALLVVPDNQPQLVLKVMAQFARIMSDPVEHSVLRSLREADMLSGWIAKHILGTETSVTARDIMRQPFAVIHPDTPLKDVTRIMHQYTLDSIAVVEEDETLAGEITCENLFKVGMPDFFSQLKSISFIREFDPFEKYFEGESEALARDVMTTDHAAVAEDATLLEIVFELSVHRHSKVYVVRDGKQVGVIDRILVLDRVINF